jgi:glycosyltransferase involved in cell wall biosynthesis
MNKSKVRVLIVGSDLSVKGGITSVIKRFLKYNFKNVEISLLPTYVEGSSLKKIKFFCKSVIKYLKKILSNEFDIVHIHMSYKGSFFRKLIIIILSKFFNKRIILHLHGSEFEIFYKKSNKFLQTIIKFTFRTSDRVIVLGKNWSDIVKKIEPKSNVDIFRNAVDIPKYKVELSNHKLNILFLGVLIKRKGIYELIEAIKVLSDKRLVSQYNLNFIIGGSGIEEGQVKLIVDKYNLNYCVDMVGWVDGELKEELLKKSQLFVLPSYNEGLPMAILEAMSYGIPIISTNVGSIDEVVINNKTGYLINPGDKDMLAEAITKSINDLSMWKKMSYNARVKIIDEFDEKKYFYLIEKLYCELVNN